MISQHLFRQGHQADQPWALADTVRETYVLEARAGERHTMDISPNVAYGNLGKKWRAERNFWISFMCFFLWWCVPFVCADPVLHCSNTSV